MFKKILFVIFTLALISNKFTIPVQAVNESAQDKQTWRCLKAEQVGGKTRVPPAEVDIALTGTGLPANFPIYIVFTVPPKSNQNDPPDQSKTIQSTGNPDSDKIIFNLSEANKSQYVDRLAALGLKVKIPSTATTNEPIQTTSGNLDLTVHLSNANGHVNYAFFAVTINEPTNTGPTLASNESGNTLQYGTFKFTSSDEGDPQKCISIRWDPYGRVFDSLSLEPMTGVKVTLLGEDKTPFRGTDLGLPNPQKTEADGMFNFPVPPGTYYLTISPPPTHQFSANPNIDPNYSKAYSFLYKPDKPIFEKAGQVKQKDVPLDPGTNAPYHSAVQIITYRYFPLGVSTKFEGYVSHPLSKVRLVGALSGTLIDTADSDEFGAWEMVVPNSKLPSNEAWSLVPVKVDITKLTALPKFLQKFSHMLTQLLPKFSLAVQAQQPSEEQGKAITIQPILTYLEGYVYDTNGRIIPNATVRIKVTWSGQKYYETKADQTGYFLIGPSNIPKFAYFLEFTSPISSVVTVMNTSDFVAKNSKYLDDNKINLMTVTKNGQSLIPTSTPAPTVAPTAAPSNILTSPSSQTSLILTLLVLFVLFAIAGGVLMYIKKKESASGTSPLS